jgi:hypothetical protein
MSKMAELDYDIQELYIDGFSAQQIAKELECPLYIVVDCLREMGVGDVAEKQQSDDMEYYGA